MLNKSTTSLLFYSPRQEDHKPTSACNKEIDTPEFLRSYFFPLQSSVKLKAVNTSIVVSFFKEKERERDK